MPGTRLGPSAIKQRVSALEYARFHRQHEALYVAQPDAQRPLRDDLRIKTFEKAAQATEPERASQVQIMKADGLKSGVYQQIIWLTDID